MATTSKSLIPIQLSQPQALETPSIKSSMTSEAVADWLTKDVEPDFWGDVIGEAKYQLDRPSIRKQRTFISSDLRGIQQECSPKTETFESFEYVNVNAEWLLTWTLALEKDTSRIHSCLAEGLKQAIANYKRLDKRLSGINGERYIGERMNGPFRP